MREGKRYLPAPPCLDITASSEVGGRKRSPALQCLAAEGKFCGDEAELFAREYLLCSYPKYVFNIKNLIEKKTLGGADCPFPFLLPFQRLRCSTYPSELTPTLWKATFESLHMHKSSVRRIWLPSPPRQFHPAEMLPCKYLHYAKQSNQSGRSM